MNRRHITLATLFTVAAMPVLALASPVPRLVEFEADTPVVAADFNDNFSALAEAVDDNDTRISAIEDQPELIVVRASNTVSTNLPSASTTIPFNDESEDSHDAYDSETGVFTCPRAGLLQVSFNVFLQGLSDSTRLIFITGPGQEYELNRQQDNAPTTNLSGALAIRCAAEGDEWRFRAFCDEADGCATRPQNGLRTYSNLSIVETR